MSGGKWEPVPRIAPEYLARWERLNGKWRLVVTDIYWDNVDSVVTDTLTTRTPPEDEEGWLGKLGFVPVADSKWEPDGNAWQRPVCPMNAQHA